MPNPQQLQRVFVVAFSDAGGGGVEWRPTAAERDAAKRALDAEYATIASYTAFTFDALVPAGLSRDEITTLVDVAAWESDRADDPTLVDLTA
jgi:hypothetical protein